MKYALKYYSKERAGEVERTWCADLDELVKESAEMAKRGFLIIGAESRPC